MRRVTTKKKIYLCVGGPWDNRHVKMPKETTVFTIGHHTGRYVEGVWQDV